MQFGAPSEGVREQSAEMKKTLVDAHHEKKKADNAKRGKLGKPVVL
jgi:hypothetical protein